jgi:hypothetical protein
MKYLYFKFICYRYAEQMLTQILEGSITFPVSQFSPIASPPLIASILLAGPLHIANHSKLP